MQLASLPREALVDLRRRFRALEWGFGLTPSLQGAWNPVPSARPPQSTATPRAIPRGEYWGIQGARRSGA
eukprot:2423776-Alexandrium_andersonii.AAC.1